MNQSKRDRTAVVLIAAVIFVLGTLLAWAILVVDFDMAENVQPPAGQQPCTLDAHICPDGTAVGREGPDCEFPECPDQAAAIKPSLV